jgi:hypothetical protein
MQGWLGQRLNAGQEVPMRVTPSEMLKRMAVAIQTDHGPG